MDQGTRFIHGSYMGSRRLLWLLGIAFSVAMVIQFCEIPNASILSSLLSAEKLNFFGKWNHVAKNGTNSGIAGNSTSTYIVGGIENEDRESPTDRTSFHDLWNKSSYSEDLEESATSASLERSRIPKVNVSPKIIHRTNNTSVRNVQKEDFSLSTESNISPAPVSELYTVASTLVVPSPIPSPMNLDLISPVASEGPILSSVQNDTKHILKTNINEIPPQRSISFRPNFSSPPDSTFLHNKSKLPALPVISISRMNELLLQSRSLSHSVPPKWNSTVDKELLYAKSSIEEVPIDERDAGTHALVYRNISMFRRSYELMDKMLKVYIYKEGEKPIFHDSILEGIYASEGWFLKLLESNKRYITEDPTKAHLFYLPFSSRLLELTLYVRHSHSRDNLIGYMKNYVDMLSQKYPFWNRTNGEDHFLAACHDWAPAETRGPLSNCLRALCNADIRVGFDIGKDVSLPTTYVRSAKNPLKDLGGEAPSQRPILAFFAGHLHGYVRPLLLDYWGKDPSMRIFSQMPRVKGNKNYIQNMKSSKYCICARGYAVNSPRVVESIFYECVPVIISDNYVPPFFEVLNWESFAVFVLEKDIANLKNILLSISMEKYIEMQQRVKEVQKHFVWHTDPVKYDLFHMTLHSFWYNRVFRIKSP